jgi:hypothetical protein
MTLVLALTSPARHLRPRPGHHLTLRVTSPTTDNNNERPNVQMMTNDAMHAQLRALHASLSRPYPSLIPSTNNNDEG